MPDPRFDRLRTDPRFRRPKKKQSKVVVDDRFRSLFVQKKQRRRVDKYGRSVSEKQEEDDLKRFYRLGDDDLGTLKSGPDYARGGVLLESSDEEDIKNEKDVVSGEESDNSSQFDGVVTIGGDLKGRDEDEEFEIDLDENSFADLDAQALAYSRTHPEAAQPDGGQRTNRLGAVNLDWDHVRAVHLYRICSSLVSPTALLASTSNTASESQKGAGVVRGRVLGVRVYPSQFGKERIAREEKEGPPVENFKKRKEDEEVNEKTIYEVGDEADYDEDALRKYQLERLRYYYAVITCDTVDAASHIYSELDGTELERSANVFDLSFVPGDMVFDDECRDEATEQDLTSNYKPLDFATDALRHSKVKLTWDGDDPERNHVTRRRLTRKEIEEADFRAYLASSSSESDESVDESVEGVDLGTKKSGKKAAERDRLRALLLDGGTDNLPEGWIKDGKDSDDVDMEITFRPGISDKKDDEHETTLEKYQKKMREKRKQRKEEKKEKAADPSKAIEGDDFFGADSDDESESDAKERTKAKGRREKNKNTKRKGEDAQAKTPVSPEELALLVGTDDPNSEAKHFNLKSVIKAEKRKGKKGRKRQMRLEEENELQADFVINVHDKRFEALHEDPQFAIDPSNPRFKKTKSMSALLEERHKRQQKSRDGAESSASKASLASGVRGLQSLVESVKRKSTNAERYMGKRRKL